MKPKKERITLDTIENRFKNRDSWNNSERVRLSFFEFVIF